MASTPTRVPVVLYVSTTSAQSCERFLEGARRYAECRDWDVIAALYDLYGLNRDGARPAWQQARDLIDSRQAAGIVTRYQTMVTSHGDAHTLQAWLAERGAWLACTWQGQLQLATT
ncbi:recombinase family protein [Streptomyces sp. PA03-6a]|nr:recombinase family protein [Streptomyces sp. PA03-6a]